VAEEEECLRAVCHHYRRKILPLLVLDLLLEEEVHQHQAQHLLIHSPEEAHHYLEKHLHRVDLDHQLQEGPDRDHQFQEAPDPDHQLQEEDPDLLHQGADLDLQLLEEDLVQDLVGLVLQLSLRHLLVQALPLALQLLLLLLRQVMEDLVIPKMAGLSIL